ncbi:MAG: hypothetical protein J6Z40_11860 [Oscillospiraceae bacterium]|nr:hypothetical protein [Oscillospiraceae bacterium]
MMTSFFDLMKYAHTGIASPGMTAYDKARARAMTGGGFPISTIEGVPPISFLSNGTPLISWSMLGNGSQSGTPTPDNPVMPEFVGVRTGNLFDYVSYFDSTFTNYNQYFDYADLQLSENTTYTLSTSYTEVGTSPRNTSFIVANPNDVPTTASGGISSISPITITTGSDGKLRLYKRISGSSEHPTKSQFDNGEWLMLNLGSTALPYVPYGYAINITTSQTVPVYLGQTQTVRKIRKLVLTGEEDWKKDTNVGASARYNIAVSDIESGTNNVLSTHFIRNTSYEINTFRTYRKNLYFSVNSSLYPEVADFKAWLAAQYAACTPVTVWYVLATPQTGITNEPLAKIGTYADELHSTDAGIIIPTANGDNVLTVDTDLQPSNVRITGHIKE